MTSPKPQEVTEEINNLLTLLALSGGSYASVASKKQQIISECDKLAKINVLAASLCKANLFSLLGDRKSCEYWLRNAELNGSREEAMRARQVALFILGNVSEAYQLFDQSEKAGGLPLLMRQATSFGLFRKAESLISKVNQAELPAILKRTIVQGMEYVDALGLDDATICEVMDIALGLLREKGLIWLDNLPEIRFLSADMGGPLVCITYRIEASPEYATQLNEVLVDRLVSADLDAVGLMVGYAGTIIETSKHVELSY